MSTNKIQPVILAGGSGTRLWPLSRKYFPKQFLSLDNGNTTLLQTTIRRIQFITDTPCIIVCNEEHRFIVAEQIRQIGVTNAKIILEPIGKNTAPAITLAAMLEQEEDKILLVLAADHVINKVSLFRDSVEKALLLTEKNRLVTFGIVPNHPETGYGYINIGKAIGTGFEVNSFVEKPDLTLAQSYINQGNYLWNSGMFMFKTSVYLKEMKDFASEIYESCLSSLRHIQVDKDFVRINLEDYEHIQSESIDYALMEKSNNVAVVKLESDWSDIGSWRAVWENLDKDENNNVLIGDVININSAENYVYSDDKLVSILGVKDLVIVNTKDAVLIANKKDVQDVKKIVDKLNLEGRSEHLNHRLVQRPWGCFDSIDSGDRYQVKRITVKPGAKLSVQMHYHRAEHWVVVSGTALITNGDKSFMLSENQSTYIPAGVVHALENPGKIPLEIIEVQSGTYLGEDDIIRFEDKYGRC